MKKKLIALVALAAMVLTMLPVAAFADESNIEINVYSFNNDLEQNDNILIAISGTGVEKGMRVVCYQDGVADAVYSGVIAKDGEDIIYVPKTNIHDLNDPSKRNSITVNVQSANGGDVYASDTFYQQYVASLPSSMKVGIDTKGGTEDRTMTFTFDAEYVPGDDDGIALSSLDASGKTLKTQDVPVSNLKAQENGTLVMTKSGLDFEKNAVSVRATFERDDEAVEDLSSTVKLESPYGKLDKMVFDFGGSTIAQGETLTGKLYYVNTDGKRYDVTDEVDSYTFNAPNGVIESEKVVSTPTVTVADDAKLGSTVTVLAFYNGKAVSTTLTVIPAVEPGDVKMNRSSGKIDNKYGVGIEFTLLDENGKTMKLSFRPTNIDIKWIDSSVSDPGFTVKATDAGMRLQTEGVLNTALNCEKPCTGKFLITLSDDKGHAHQVLSDTFTFKDPNAASDGADEVKVTIGSTTMMVDGKATTIIAPPIIDNNRTYVPLRAIGEAFGATVNWEQATNRITIDRNDTHIVMTPYRLAYTVNGVEKEMDVAPYISTAYNSTMVPLRFIADAFGFETNITSNADGTTRDVIITAK